MSQKSRFLALFAVIAALVTSTSNGVAQPPATATSPTTPTTDSSNEANRNTPPPTGKHVRLAATGRTWGFGSYRSSGAAILLLWEFLAEKGGGAWIDRSGQAVLRKGDSYVFDPVSARGSGVIQWMRSKKRKTANKSIQVPVLETDTVMIFGHPDDKDLDIVAAMTQRNANTGDQPALTRRTARLARHIDGKDNGVWQLQVDGKITDPGHDPVGWDQWWGIRGTAQLGQRKSRYFLVIKPWGDAARRHRLLASLVPRPDLLVSVGSELSTYGWLSGQPSPFRAAEAAALGTRGYRAIVPDRGELYDGVDALKKLLKPHKVGLLATNLYRKEGKKKPKPAAQRIMVTTVRGVTVALLGLVSKNAVQNLRADKFSAELQVRDPVAEAVAALDELRKLPGPKPELVVAITNCRGQALYDLVHQPYGIDLVVTGAGRFALHPPTRIANAPKRGRERLHGRSPLLVSDVGTTRIATIDVAMSAGKGRRVPVQIRHDDHMISPDLPRDETVHKTIAARSIQTLPTRERVIIPALETLIGDDKEMLEQVRGDPEFARFLPKSATRRWQQLWFTGRLWSQLVANVIARATGAEVAMVPRRNSLPSTVPGPLVEGYIGQWMRADNTIQVRRIKGSRLKTLAARLGDGASIAGMDRKAGLVRGRRIRDAETYVVAITRRLASKSTAANPLNGSPVAQKFRWEGRQLRPDSSGQKTSVPDVVFAILRGIRQDDPKLGKGTQQLMAKWLRPNGKEMTPRWEVAIKNLTLSFTQYSNFPSAAWLQFPGVREQRVVTPGNYALGGRAHLRGGYSSEAVAWTVSLKPQFARTVINLADIGKSEVTQETADDFLAMTEAQLRTAQLQLGPRAKWALVPYLNATYDTEFTATKSPLTGQPFAHQKELRVSAGVVLKPGGWLSELRVAALTETDFAAVQGAFEAGVQTGVKLGFPLGRARLGISGDLRWLAPSDQDTAPDQGIVFQGQAKLKVPIVTGLAAALMADVFAYTPKLREIQSGGQTLQREGSASVVLSAGLSFSRLWKR